MRRVAALAALLCVAVCDARLFTYQHFCSWPQLVVAPGPPRTQGVFKSKNRNLELIEALPTTSYNALWMPDAISLNSYSGTHPIGFRIAFSFHVSENTDMGAPNGVTLSFQGAVNGPGNPMNVGRDGYSMGYGGLTNTLSVEFDFVQDTLLNDPNSNHISIHANGLQGQSAREVAPLGVTNCVSSDGNVWYSTSVPDMTTGNSVFVVADYDGKHLSITVGGGGTGGSPQLVCDVNWAQALGSVDNQTRALIGFTASNNPGKSTKTVVLESWKVETTAETNDPNPTLCFDHFSGDQCTPNPDEFGCTGGESCAHCNTISRSCCGWCPAADKCQPSTYSGVAPAGQTCGHTLNTCSTRKPKDSTPDGPGVAIGVTLGLMAVLALSFGAIVYHQRKNGKPMPWERCMRRSDASGPYLGGSAVSGSAGGSAGAPAGDVSSKYSTL